MATRIVTEVRDDIDGSHGAQTIQFGLDGVTYEIDLSTRNANRLRNSLGEFIEHARKVGGRSSGGRRPGKTDKGDPAAMRAWLQEQGHDVSARGRIPAHLQELYHSSNR